MGDVLTLVEKAEAAIKEEDAEAMTKRLLSAKFDFNDFLKQYKMVSGMGSMGSIMKMLPGQHALPPSTWWPLPCSVSYRSWSMFSGHAGSARPDICMVQNI